MNKSLKNDQIMNWYLSTFKKFEKTLNGDREVFYHSLRNKAIERFKKLGFPTTRVEDWKYTNINPLLEHHFDIVNVPSSIGANDIENFRIGGINHNILVFVNGKFNDKFSFLTSVDKGIIIKSLTTAFSENKDLVQKYITQYASYSDEPFTALNTAFTNDGTFIYIPNNTILEEPIHILNISDHSKVDFQSHVRNLIIIGKNSQIRLLETSNHLDHNTYFQNVVSEIIIGENAIVDHVKIQDESKKSYRIATTQVNQETSSNYRTFSIDLGGRIVRNNLTIRINGEQAESNLYGFYFVNGNQHIDNHTNIEHLVPYCNSNELYKGILSGKSRGVFSGTIYVAKDAQKTNAFQSNKNLLLSEEAEIDTKPQLKIFADDVKCSHGATIGQIDKEALFYLRQRGLNESDANALLRYAFAADVLEKINIRQIRNHVNHIVSERLQKELEI